MEVGPGSDAVSSNPALLSLSKSSTEATERAGPGLAYPLIVEGSSRSGWLGSGAWLDVLLL